MGPGFRRDDVGMDSADPSQRLVIIAVAVALWRGDVAVFVILVLGSFAFQLLFQLLFRLLGLVVVLLRRLVLPASSTHIDPFSPD